MERGHNLAAGQDEVVAGDNHRRLVDPELLVGLVDLRVAPLHGGERRLSAESLEVGAAVAGALSGKLVQQSALRTESTQQECQRNAEKLDHEA